jgi:hypothetical protein
MMLKTITVLQGVLVGVFICQGAPADAETFLPDEASLYADLARSFDPQRVSGINVQFTECSPASKFGCSVRNWFSALDDGVRLRASHVELINREEFLSYPGASPARLELLRRAETVIYNLGNTVVKYSSYPNMPEYPGPKEWNNVYLVDCGNCPSEPTYSLWNPSNNNYGRVGMIPGGWYDRPRGFFKDVFAASSKVVFPQRSSCGGLEVLNLETGRFYAGRPVIDATYAWNGGGTCFSITYDARTLPAPLRIVQYDANGNMTSMQVFDGWERSGKHLWPRLVETYAEYDGWKTPVSRIEIQSCEINPEFLDSDFAADIPEDGPVLDCRTWPFLVDGKPAPETLKVHTWDEDGNPIEMTEEQIRARFGF